jgi:hypothetical protein
MNLFGQREGSHRTTNPCPRAPKTMSATYRGSHTTALPKCCVCSPMTFSWSQNCPEEVTGRNRKMEPWFSTRMSGEGRRLVSRQVGLDPDASNAFFMVSPFVQEKAVRRIDLGERLRWVFAPYRPHPSKFWRLAPWRFFSLGCRGAKSCPLLILGIAYGMNCDLKMVRKYLWFVVFST